MKLRQTLLHLAETPGNGDDRVQIAMADRSLNLYPRSIVAIGRALLFVGRGTPGRRLYVVASPDDEVSVRFDGTCLKWAFDGEDQVRRCRLSHANAVVVRELLDWTRPRVLGLADSFGLGDRLGIAGPAHLRAMTGSGFEVVLAQQSIRELERTERTPDEVMDAATWAVLQEGWTSGFGADADHLKTPADVELMAGAGFTMFTIDPGDHVVDAADEMSVDELLAAAAYLPWADLQTSLDGVLERFVGQQFEIGPDLVLEPTTDDVLRGLVKYGAALAHVASMYRHIVRVMGDRPFEIEVSVDETTSVTSPFEHWLVASELKRLGVEWVGLAPRFVGDFEKGIDYRGDLEAFRREYLKHLAIADTFGPYKISIHSGSDKFGVYRTIGEIGAGHVHVKTAGTSYLEALRAVASCEPALFREILDFARSLYEHERRTYHVSGRLDRVPPVASLDGAGLLALLDDEDARQVLHVTFGRVLTERGPDGRTLFKDRIMTCLEANEDVHFRNLVTHFRRHTEPFGRNR
jgi:hypothetical protein